MNSPPQSNFHRGTTISGSGSLGWSQRWRVLGKSLPQNGTCVLEVKYFSSLSRNVESKQFKFHYETRIRDIVKKLKSDRAFQLSSGLTNSNKPMGAIPRNSDETVDLESLESSLAAANIPAPSGVSETTLGLFIPQDQNSLIPGDECKMEEDYFLWQYDMAPVQSIEWKEIPIGMNYHQYVFLRILISLETQTSSTILKFKKTTLIKDAIAAIRNKLTTIRNTSHAKGYGLYVWTMSGEGGAFSSMDEDRTLESYKLASMDIVEFKELSNYEFAFMTNTDVEHPDSLSFSENTKIKDVLRVVQDYVLRSADDNQFGLLYIPTKNHTELTHFTWMDENRSISEYKPQQYDIFEFKKRDPEQGSSVTSTLDANNMFPSTKLILVDIKSPQQKPAATGKKDDSSKRHQVDLEEGERILESVSPVFFHQKLLQQALNGSIVVTNFLLSFLPNHPELIDPYILPVFRVPLSAISRIEKIGKQDQWGLVIHCKDLRSIAMEFQTKEARRRIFTVMDHLAFGDMKHLFAFSYKPLKFQSSRFNSSKQNGYNVFSVEEEFKRIFQNFPQQSWKITNVNQDFTLSETYPKQLIVPVNISDEVLRIIAGYRSKGRLPVLVWAHPHNQASLTRSSQPLAGIKRNRCVEDELYLRSIRDMAGNPDQLLYIFDARPRANALANFAVGGGFENTAFYQNTVIEFLNIENIHVMRASLAKVEHLAATSTNWLNDLEATHWLEHIRLLLEGTGRIIDTLDNGSPCLLHCSDGWDRTAQFSSLVQLCLDPYFRTIQGFEVLIEKEWISFGHKFNDRIGHLVRAETDDQRSPIFLQFIDCTFQLLQQFPCCFEFNEHFLITILDHLYSGKFGTFLYNNENVRSKEGLRIKTISLWSVINCEDVDQYTNPFFVPAMDIIKPHATMEEMVLWKGYYLRWHRKIKPPLTKELRGRMIQNTVQNLTERLRELERIKADLEAQLVRAPRQQQSSNGDPLGVTETI